MATISLAKISRLVQVLLYLLDIEVNDFELAAIDSVGTAMIAVCMRTAHGPSHVHRL